MKTETLFRGPCYLVKLFVKYIIASAGYIRVSLAKCSYAVFSALLQCRLEV